MLPMNPLEPPLAVARGHLSSSRRAFLNTLSIILAVSLPVFVFWRLGW